MGRRAGLDVLEREKSVALAGFLILDSPAHSLVAVSNALLRFHKLEINEPKCVCA
jgi:hypothetical protein